jgi:hypothetical protein
MSLLGGQSEAWDTAFWELSLVFEGLEDGDLWRRPHPRLLSVGEIVAHVVYWLETYAAKLDGSYESGSPLALNEARYYLHNINTPLTPGMTVSQVATELERVQSEAKKVLLNCPHGRNTPLPFEGPGRTCGQLVDYMVFHTAYHTGQAFSARHVMNHKTNDN